MTDYERIDTKLDNVLDTLSCINVTLAKQAVVLEHHAARSTALEGCLDVLRHETKPLHTHVAVVVGLTKFVAGVGALVALALGLMQLLGKLA